MADLLITIHGVNCEANPGWQNDLGATFNRSFIHLPCSYRGFRGFRVGLGLIRVFLCPITFLLVAGFVYGGFCYLTPQHSKFVLAGIVIAAALPVALFVSYVARKHAVDHLYLEIQSKIRDSQVSRPNIIAHSFGTYLIGKALQEYPTLSVGRVVLYGSVLPRKYDWETLRGRVEAVRNEVGLRDGVVKLGRWFCWLVPGMGTSGTGEGFYCPPDFVANKALPIDHGKAWKDDAYYKTFWVPFLWTYREKEVHDWRNACANGWKAQASADVSLSDKHLEDFKRTTWTWTKSGGKQLSMEDFLSNSIRDSLSASLGRTAAQFVTPEVSAVAIQNVWKLGENPYLRPELAVERAVKSVVWLIVKHRKQ